jgi:uncharacterized protein YcfL
MKKYILILCSFICASMCSAQTTNDSIAVNNDSTIVANDSVVSVKVSVAAPKTLEERLDSMIQMNNAILDQIELDLSLKQRYKLYPTDNLYNFLKLDTKTGEIYQVQWSLDSDEEFSVIVNGRDLNWGYGNGSGTFELYPTKNTYQFILLDKTNGRTWHVQWGHKRNERWIRPIY